MKYLSLSNNLLDKVPVNSLDSLEELLSLYIAYNHITHLQDGSFLKLRKINMLGLSDNGIVTITKNAFLGLLSLISLDMSGNQLADTVAEFILPPPANIFLSNSNIKHILGPLLVKSRNQKIDLSFNNLSVLHLAIE